MISLGKLNKSRNTINDVLLLGGTNIAAIAQPENAEAQRFSQMRNWSGQRQTDQMQRQINRLESELRRNQNPRRPDFRSYGRSFRIVESDPVCSFC